LANRDLRDWLALVVASLRGVHGIDEFAAYRLLRARGLLIGSDLPAGDAAALLIRGAPR
jgi:hypothetical protein